jgi:hypothetical protein
VNQLKQIALAMHWYHDVHKHLPSGTLPVAGLSPEQRFSFFATILPYLEQKPLYDQLILDRAWDAEGNLKAISRCVPTFQCPAGAPLEPGATPNQTHYVGLAGLGSRAAELPASDPRAGVFGYDRTICLSDIQVNTSNVAALMETNSEVGPWAPGGASTIRGLGLQENFYICDGCPFGAKHRTDTFFRSNPVLANTGFADGSVRAIQEDISLEVLRAIVRIAGREPVPLDF